MWNTISCLFHFLESWTHSVQSRLVFWLLPQIVKEEEPLALHKTKKPWLSIVFGQNRFSEPPALKFYGLYVREVHFLVLAGHGSRPSWLQDEVGEGESGLWHFHKKKVRKFWGIPKIKTNEQWTNFTKTYEFERHGLVPRMFCSAKIVINKSIFSASPLFLDWHQTWKKL